jgi:iron complex outermembrane recepter protein
VLKGPQGTLFGRNAAGGAINIITSTPSFDPQGKLEVSYGRFNEVDVGAYVTGGITDKLAADASFFMTRDDGYIRDVYLGTEDGATQAYMGRSKLLFEPTDHAKLTLAVDGAYTNYNAPLAMGITNALTTLFDPHEVLPSGPYQDAYPYPSVELFRNYGLSLTGEFNFSGFDVISISAYGFSRQYINSSLSATPLQFFNFRDGLQSQNESQDLRFQSNSNGRFKWVGGLYLYDSREASTPDNSYINPYNDPFITNSPAGSPPVTQSLTANTGTFAWAVYGQGTVGILDKLNLTIGARYNQDHKTENFSQTTTIDGVTFTNQPYGSAGRTWRNVSPKVTVDYQLASKTMLYATWSEGFKSGEFNVLSFEKTPVDPEKLYDTEFGIKTDFTDHLRANIAAFHYNFDDIQVQYFGTSVTNFIWANAARAQEFGAEGEFTATYQSILAMDDRITLTSGIAYLDAYYTSYHNAIAAVPTSYGDQNATIDATGNRLIMAPHLTESVGVHYVRPTSIGDISFDTNAYHNSGYFNDSANTVFYAQPSYTTLNMKLGWDSLGGRYSTSVWGTNMTNALIGSVPLTSVLGTVRFYQKPAVYGVTFGYHFK